MNAVPTNPRIAGRGRPRWQHRAVRLGAISLCAALTAARADAPHDHRHDHDQARAAVEAGEILPLPVVLEQLQRTHPGQVLGIDLEKDEGRWIYEIKLLRSDGRLIKLEMDARTAQVQEHKHKGGKMGRGRSADRSASEPGR